jgi:hypothetical protein
MNSPSSVISALTRSAFAESYYQLCAEHQLGEYAPCACPQKEVIAALSELGTITKLKGPGSVFSVRPHIPLALELSYVIQGRITVELMLSWSEGESSSGSNFAVLASEVLSSKGLPLPTPPYPRPNFHSLAELRKIVSVALSIASAASNAYAPNIAVKRDAPQAARPLP